MSEEKLKKERKENIRMMLDSQDLIRQIMGVETDDLSYKELSKINKFMSKAIENYGKRFEEQIFEKKG